MLPLDATTVVSLEQAVAAPLATRHLADLGARVIKVERPGVGDFARDYDRSTRGQSSYFAWLNRGKESIELDLKDPADRAVLDRIIAAADVVVQNLAPGAVDRLGLAPATLRAADPGLVYCSISGYGSTGPYRSKKAYDLLVQCEAGLLSVTGTPDQPAKAGISVADIATGCYAHSGVLSALLLRERTGLGSTLEVAMLDALGEWMTQPTYYAVYGGHPPRRTGARHASIAPYGPFRAARGAPVFLGVQSDREWEVLCLRVLDRPDLVTDPRFANNPARVENNDDLTAILEGAFADQDADDVMARLDEAGIACARLRTPVEFHEHPQLRARDRWRSVGVPGGGRVDALLPAVAFDGLDLQMGDVPSLGEHNHALRAEFATAENGRSRPGQR